MWLLPSSLRIHRLLLGLETGGEKIKRKKEERLIYIIKLKPVSLENISSGVRTWEMLFWDICSKTPLATKPWEGCGVSVIHDVLGRQILMQGREKCLQRCVCAWQKVRETLKERCKSYKVKTDPPQEHYLCISLLSADGFPNSTGGLGEAIQFNSKNLEEIA